MHVFFFLFTYLVLEYPAKRVITRNHKNLYIFFKVSIATEMSRVETFTSKKLV